MNKEMYELLKNYIENDIDTIKRCYNQIPKWFGYSMEQEPDANRAGKRLFGNMTDGYVEVDEKDYAKNLMIKDALNSVFGNPINPKNQHQSIITLSIKNVIFNNPATIVYWLDGTKTVVKCSNEEFDREKGLCMAIVKKISGNQGSYYNQIKKWVKDNG